MRTPPIRVLALDLDGTLTNSQKIITPRTREAVMRAGEAGYTVALASGRPVRGISHLAEQLELKRLGGYIMACNGAQVFSCQSGETVYSAAVPTGFLPRIKRICDEFHLAMICYDEKEVITDRPDDPVVQYEARNDSMPIRTVGDLVASVTWPSHKIMVVGKDEEVAACLACAQEAFKGELHVFLSDRCFLEFCMPGVAKDTGLMHMMRHLNLPMASLMAFGDGLNDIEMLREAGLAVAMENAYPEVKAVADFVTASNDEDGVALAIDKFLFGEETL